MFWIRLYFNDTETLFYLYSLFIYFIIIIIIIF